MTESVYDRCKADEAPTLDYCERIAGCTLPDAPDEFDSDEVTAMMETARAMLCATPAASVRTCADSGAQLSIF